MNEFLKCYPEFNKFYQLIIMISNYFWKSKNAYGKMPLRWSKPKLLYS